MLLSSGVTYSKTEELQVIIGEVVNGVSNTSTQESLHQLLVKLHQRGTCQSYLELISKDLSLVGASGEVLSGRLGGSGVTKDSSPLLDGLVVVLDVKGRIGGSVVDLHLGSRSVVAGVHVLDNVGPLGLGVDGLSLGAG